PAITHQNAYLAQLLGELHAGRDHFLACRLAPNHFQQLHHIGRTEKVRTQHCLRPLGRGGDLVNIEVRSVSRQDRTRFADAVENGEHFLLESHALEYRLHHQVHAGKFVIAEDRADQLQTLVHELLGEAAALYRVRVGLLDRPPPPDEGRLVHVPDYDRHAGVGKHHGDSSAHGSGADHSNSIDGEDRRIFGNPGNLRQFPLCQEGVDEGPGLVGKEALVEKLLLNVRSVGIRQRGRCFYGVNGGQRGSRSALFAPSVLAGSGEQRHVMLELLVAFARLPHRLANRLAREGDRRSEQIAVDVHHLVDYAELHGFRGRDWRAQRTHLDCLSHSRQAWQTLRPASAGNNAELHFRLAHLCAGTRDPVMSGHGQLHSASEGVPVNGRHDRLVAVFDALNQPRHLRYALAAATGDCLKFVNVGPGDEGAASSDEHDGGNPVVVVRLLDGFANRLAHLSAQRVHRRIVDGDDSEALLVGNSN